MKHFVLLICVILNWAFHIHLVGQSTLVGVSWNQYLCHSELQMRRPNQISKWVVFMLKMAIIIPSKMMTMMTMRMMMESSSLYHLVSTQLMVRLFCSGFICCIMCNVYLLKEIVSLCRSSILANKIIMMIQLFECQHLQFEFLMFSFSPSLVLSPLLNLLTYFVSSN